LSAPPPMPEPLGKAPMSAFGVGCVGGCGTFGDGRQSGRSRAAG